MVDAWSSRELKKMLYLTRRRVRYLYTNSLDNFGAFFKSGSLYRFSENAERIQYQGDTVNVLNALVEIDTSEAMPLELKKDEATEGSEKPKNEVPKTDAVTEPAPKTTETEADKAAAVAAKPRPYVYIVAVMSNELKRNAALDHSKLAEAIHAAITAPHEDEATESLEGAKKN
jgi:hypothetical protein